MKNVLFVIPEYIHGGTNKTLENLLTFMDMSNYIVSIYAIREDGGEYYRKVFDPYIVKKSLWFYWTHDNYFVRKIANVIRKLFCHNDYTILYKREIEWLQQKYHFDTIVAYQEGSPTHFVSLLERINVKKITWFHSPYLWVINKDVEQSKDLYSKFDKIVCVSNTFANLFKNVMPELSDKVISIHNTMNDNLVLQMSDETITDVKFDNRCFNIVSVGRFVHQKRFDVIPGIARKLKDQGVDNLKWYIIASGKDERNITEEEIKKKDVSDCVIILGERNNPYPYIKNSDLMVVTSETESYPTVINEAKVLHTPIVSSDYASAKEILPTSCGFVTSIEEMPNLLFDIINNKNNIYTNIKKSISSYRYENEEIMKQVYSIL